MYDATQIAKMSITEVLDEISSLTAVKKTADAEIKEEIAKFEAREDIKKLQQTAADAEVMVSELRDVLLERMRKENMQALEAPKGHAHVTKKVKAKWDDEAKLIELIESNETFVPLREFIARKIQKPDTAQKKLLEIIEIENPVELEGLVETEETYTLTVTPKKDGE